MRFFLQGLEVPSNTPRPTTVVTLRRPQSLLPSAARTSSYRFSMANLEETHESELDAILGELNMLEQKNGPHQNHTSADLAGGGATTNGSHHPTAAAEVVMGTGTLMGTVNLVDPRLGRSHSRSNSTLSHVTNSTISSISTSSESGTGSGSESGALREPRTDSPDNDSAFSDTVSLLSSESSASSGVSSGHSKNLPLHSNLLQVSKI